MAEGPGLTEPYGKTFNILVTTTENIPGKQYEIIGIVQGNAIQTKNIGRDFTQGLRHIAGGELKAYVDMVSKARALSTERMLEEAEAIGADAVVCLRYASSTVSAGAAEILAFGTAVKYV
ncbi:MAG: heavy metal-binding domain-containing protein [Candidatus Methanomethylophilus sp.]|nr:heavy metal-binding domain-containing protein [Methanomethylophilus sp.]